MPVYPGALQTSVKSSATLRRLTAPCRWRSRLRFGAESSPRSSAHADGAVRRPAGTDAGTGTQVVLDAAFLIPAVREKNFRAGVDKLTRRLSAAFDVTLSGPWPPYNFVKKAL